MVRIGLNEEGKSHIITTKKYLLHFRRDRAREKNAQQVPQALHPHLSYSETFLRYEKERNQSDMNKSYE